ncbi:MAG: zinc-ribbon domain containing protein [Chloroflexi bacterium]|nr:zinc-ribbon domain containing protein [Chloroflexota bacterium]
MAFQDKNLACAECGNQFVFTASEQEFFASKGYTNEPKRCPSCREARRARDGGSRTQRQFYSATCARCGGVAQVPFQPRGDKPVYCSDCFSLVRAQSGPSGGSGYR